VNDTRTAWTARVDESIADIDADAWDHLVGDGSPFVEYRWLRAMEDTGCVDPEHGWLPQIVTLYEGDRLVGALPTYLKGNSYGEFVYDWAWADLAHRLGVDYYPKLIVASPFSPVTGPRVLVDPDGSEAQQTAWRSALADAMTELVQRSGVSGAHVLFAPEAEARALEDRGWFVRVAHQYHWHNDGYRDFDDFLSRFRSKRRRSIRRERRRVREAGYTVESIAGTELDEATMDRVFGFYASTCDRYVWGRQYLNRAFFAQVHDTMPERIRVFIARDADGEIVAGTFNLEKGDRMYGRYWGSTVDVDLLHFETCYYAMIEHAIAHGMQAIEPGQGGEHKYTRGFSPQPMYSAHRIRDRRLGWMLQRHTAQESGLVLDEVERKREAGPLRSDD